jgi:protein-tyrosine phosphatase
MDKDRDRDRDRDRAMPPLRALHEDALLSHVKLATFLMKTDIIWIRGPRRGRLAIAARPRGGDWLDDEVEAWRSAGVDCVVSALTPAEETEFDLAEEPVICQRHGLRYISLPIPDRGVPSSRPTFIETVDDIRDDLDSGGSVLIHCRQGIGRSSLIAASVLADTGETPDAAFASVQQSRGRTVLDTEEQRNWVRSFAARPRNAQPPRRPHRRVADPMAHA